MVDRPEDAVIARVLSYLDDWRTFETIAEQIEPMSSPQSSHEQRTAIDAAYREWQARHRAAPARARIRGYVCAPTELPDEVQVESVLIKGRRATVVTREASPQTGGFDPDRYQYVLAKEGADWLLVDRRWFDTWTGKWVRTWG